MGYYDDDLYYNPEKFGLRTVGDVEWRNESYEFDMTVVWYHEENQRFYWASDSGCSCPSPFEAFTSLEDPDVSSGSAWQAIGMLTARHGERPDAEDDWSWDRDHWDQANPQVVRLCELIMEIHRSK